MSHNRPLSRYDPGYQHPRAITDTSPVAVIKERIRKAEVWLDTLFDPIKSYLPITARVLVVSTFLEDALRLVSQWYSQLLYLQNYRKIPSGLSHFLLIINMVTMTSCSILIIAQKHTLYATCGLFSSIITQAIEYQLLFDSHYFLRNLSVGGGLLMALADSWISQQPRTAGLPKLEYKDHKMYFQLGGRLLLLVMFIAFLFAGRVNTWRVLGCSLGFIASVMIFVGFKAKWSAIMLAFLLGTFNIWVNSFWMLHPENPHRDFAQYDFFQVLSIIGGLLFLIHMGPGKLSFDEKKKE